MSGMSSVDSPRPPMCHGQPMVVRRRRRWPSPGGFFWGCATYPRCSRTINIAGVGPTPDPLAAPAPRREARTEVAVPTHPRPLDRLRGILGRSRMR